MADWMEKVVNGQGVAATCPFTGRACDIRCALLGEDRLPPEFERRYVCTLGSEELRPRMSREVVR